MTLLTLDRTFYNQFKTYTEDHGTRKLKWFLAIEAAIFVYGTIRIGFSLCIVLGGVGFSGLWKYDWVTILVNHFSYDPLLLLMSWLLGIFAFYSGYAMVTQFDPQDSTFLVWYRVVVHLQDQYHRYKFKDPNKIIEIQRKKQLEVYRKCSSGVMGRVMPEILLKQYCKLRAQAEIWINLEYVDHKKLFRKNSEFFNPELSPKLLTKILLTFILADKVCYWVQLVVGKKIT